MRAIAVFMILLLGACGQSGDLYLPTEPAPVPAETSVPAAVPGPVTEPPGSGEKEKKETP